MAHMSPKQEALRNRLGRNIDSMKNNNIGEPLNDTASIDNEQGDLHPQGEKIVEHNAVHMNPGKPSVDNALVDDDEIEEQNNGVRNDFKKAMQTQMHGIHAVPGSLHDKVKKHMHSMK